MSVLKKSEEFENVIRWLLCSDNYQPMQHVFQHHIQAVSQANNDSDPDAALKEFVVKMCAAILLHSSVQRQEQFRG